MLEKKIGKNLVAVVVCLSLIFGQGVVFAADQGALANGKENTSMRVTSNDIEGVMLYVTDNGVRVRAKPTTSAKILGLLYADNDDYIIVTNETSGWVYGHTSTGIWGWISSEYVENLS